MPNWAFGQVNVTGKAKNIEKFCRLFLFTEDTEKEGVGKRYFARSFTNDSWESFYGEYIKDYEPEEETSISFSVDFAWSCHSCMIDGYPDGKECVTLQWACKEYNVDVEIDTEETGCCFTEHITCSKNGDLVEECEDMPEYTCQNCGSKQSFPEDYDLESEECGNCGRVGEWEDKLVKLMEKKIQMEIK